MIQPINRDIKFLSQKSELAKPADKQTIQDLIDTFKANEDKAVGMAANMIGEKKQIIVVKIGVVPFIMVNPIIVKKEGQYETEESCLSLLGQRKTTRYKKIKVQFLDINFISHEQTFTDFVAQIIQHEVDHCNGIII